MPEPGGSQGFNRYAYANDNPLRYTDPTGHCSPEARDRHPGCSFTEDKIVGRALDDLDASVNKALAVTHEWISYQVGNVASALPPVYGYNYETGEEEWSNIGLDLGGFIAENTPLLNESSFYEGFYATDRLATQLASQGFDLKIGIVLEANMTGGKPVYRGGPDLTPTMRDVKIDPATGLVKTTHGVSLHQDPTKMSRFGGAYRIMEIPDGLQVQQRGQDLQHYEIMPSKPMTFEEFSSLLKQVILEPFQ